MLRVCMLLQARASLSSCNCYQQQEGASFDVGMAAVSKLVITKADLPVCGHDADGKVSGLEAVMAIWLERQAEFMGTYKINLATTALTHLLACRHPALAGLQACPPSPTLLHLPSSLPCVPHWLGMHLSMHGAPNMKPVHCCHKCKVACQCFLVLHAARSVQRDLMSAAVCQPTGVFTNREAKLRCNYLHLQTLGFNLKTAAACTIETNAATVCSASDCNAAH